MHVGKWLIAFVAVYSFGGLVADFIVPSTSRQHIWNPAWPPHAKFHNGQTMLMGIFGGALALLVLFATGPLTLTTYLIAAAAAASYWVSMALSPIFPGTEWYDPEFADLAPRPFGLSPQQMLAYVLCTLALVAVLVGLFDLGES